MVQPGCITWAGGDAEGNCGVHLSAACHPCGHTCTPAPTPAADIRSGPPDSDLTALPRASPPACRPSPALPPQSVRVTQKECEFSLYDLPASEGKCAPSYNASAEPGADQRIPVFELPPGSYFLRAEEAGHAAFKLLEEKGPK